MNIIDTIIKLNSIKNFNINYNLNFKNRANAMGENLEIFIQNLFADSFNIEEKLRNEKINKTFSYIGNNSNPPDAMLLGGDAIEVKKVENKNKLISLSKNNNNINIENIKIKNPDNPAKLVDAKLISLWW